MRVTSVELVDHGQAARHPQMNDEFGRGLIGSAMIDQQVLASSTNSIDLAADRFNGRRELGRPMRRGIDHLATTQLRFKLLADRLNLGKLGHPPNCRLTTS